MVHRRSKKANYTVRPYRGKSPRKGSRCTVRTMKVIRCPRRRKVNRSGLDLLGGLIGAAY